VTEESVSRETSSFHIRRLTQADTHPYVALRTDGLERAPFSFAASPSDDRAQSPDFVREMLGHPDQAVFGAFSSTLVGIVGVYRDSKLKMAHKCHVWGLYVAPEVRRQGVARRLILEAIRFGQSLPGVTHIHLVVNERTRDAMTLYTNMGFVTWGVEPAGLRVEGIESADHHMVVRLPLPPGR
jgi:ribosomal protein S18 acetylase RimI-like enzyme